MPLFEVAAIKKPTKKEVEDGTGKETIVLPITAIVAKDHQMAGLQVARGLPPDLDLDHVEILVRPFTQE